MGTKEFKIQVIFNIEKDAPLRSILFYSRKYNVDLEISKVVARRIKDYQYNTYKQTLRYYYIDGKFN